MLQMLRHMKQRDEIQAARLKSSLRKSTDLKWNAEHVPRIFCVADIRLDATSVETELPKDEDKLTAARPKIEQTTSTPKKGHEITQTFQHDTPRPVSMLQAWLPGLLVGHAITLAIKVVDLRGIWARIGEDKAAAFTNNGSQRLPFPVCAAYLPKMVTVTNFAVLDGRSAKGVQWH